jgi:hypothetical protein
MLSPPYNHAFKPLEGANNFSWQGDRPNPPRRVCPPWNYSSLPRLHAARSVKSTFVSSILDSILSNLLSSRLSLSRSVS